MKINRESVRQFFCESKRYRGGAEGQGSPTANWIGLSLIHIEEEDRCKPDKPSGSV